MSNGKINLYKLISIVSHNVLPISVFFYIILTKYFPKNGYKFIKQELSLVTLTPAESKIEYTNQSKLRKKILQDLKFHALSKNWKKRNVTKFFFSTEGKIIGYKFYKIFYPNYFTKPQITNINNKILFFKKPMRIVLIVIKDN